MLTLREVARSVRHAPGLRSLGVWDVLRPHYYRFLDRGNGSRVKVGGRVAIPMPADLTTTDWRKFEPATVNAFANWIERHPTGVVLDLGSSVGIYSAIALALSPVSEVFSFDGDAIGLRISENIAMRLGAHGRHHQLWTLVSDSGEDRTLDSIEALSAQRIDALPLEPASSESVFVNLDSEAGVTVPRVALDALFGTWSDRRPILLKIDIEGAELLALRGATKLLTAARPTICLSVHPWLIEKYGGTVADLSAFLSEHGYSVAVIEKDWEEHWWCEPR